MKKILFALAVLCSFSCFAAPGGLTSPIISGGGGSGGVGNTNALSPTQNNLLTNSAQLPLSQYGVLTSLPSNVVTNHYLPLLLAAQGQFTNILWPDGVIFVHQFISSGQDEILYQNQNTFWDQHFLYNSDGSFLVDLLLDKLFGNGLGVTNTPSSTLSSTNGTVTIARSVNPVTGETNYDLAASGGGGGGSTTNQAGFTNDYASYFDNVYVFSNGVYFVPGRNETWIGTFGPMPINTSNSVVIGSGAGAGGPDYDTVAIGYLALNSLVGDSLDYRDNTAVGAHVMQGATFSTHETAFGGSALFSDLFGDGNTAVGWESMYFWINGNFNSIIGYEAANGNGGCTGSANSWLGSFTGQSGTTANQTILIGAGVDFPTATPSAGYGSIGNVIKLSNAYGNGSVASSTPITNSVVSVGKEPTNTVAGFDVDGALFANHGFQVPITQAGSTNLTLVGATTQGILFLHPMPTTNYVPVVVLNGATVAGAFTSNLTTNGFTQNMTALTFTGKMLWSVTSFTQ